LIPNEFNLYLPIHQFQKDALKMDPLTQGLVGTAAATIAADEKKQRPAAITGFISATLADLDFFIHTPSDPLLNIELHRHFTHSLFFIPAGALVAAGLLFWFMRRHLTFKELYLFSFVSYGTAGLLDACTSYGTMLLWPLSDTRFAWNLISVVDPVFTLVILGLLAFSFYKKNLLLTKLAIVWMGIYLLFGLFQHERATHFAERLAVARGHLVERMVVKPTIGNLLVWRSTYETADRFYADGVRVGFSSWEAKIYTGKSAPRFFPEEELATLQGTTLYSDVQRFSKLSEDYLVQHPRQEDVIGDARYSMLPTLLIPLWGIKADTDKPDHHTEFLYFRDASPEVREKFTKMIFGKEIQ